MECVHAKGWDSTLRTILMPVSPETKNHEMMFAVKCTKCGKLTWPYYTVEEAILQARHEQWSLYSQKEDGNGEVGMPEVQEGRIQAGR